MLSFLVNMLKDHLIINILEIFNGTGDDIDLSLYAISSCSNGCDDESTWDYPFNITFETGTIFHLVMYM